MFIYFAHTSISWARPFLEMKEKTGLKRNFLCSFFYLKETGLKKYREVHERFFLDSGAYSAHSLGKPIILDDYIAFIKRNQEMLDVYAVLDDIGSAQKTAENLAYMESKGLSPLPCYHWGEPYELLEGLIAKYDYFAIGGMVPISTKDLIPWLDECFSRICDKEGNPKVKVHGFGLTTFQLIKKYPWHSVDSSSWALTAAMGGIYLPSGKTLSLSKSDIISQGDKQFIEQSGWSVQDLQDNYFSRTLINMETAIQIEKELTDNPPRFIHQQLSLL